MKIAIVSGARGQTGSYMCELLLEEGGRVYGLHRRCSQNIFTNLKNCLDHPNFELIEGDITDFSSISGIIEKIKPDYFFNYAAQSHVKSSFDQPIQTFEVNTLGVLNILESIRRYSPFTKLLQSSSSEQFGSNYNIKYKDFASKNDGTRTLEEKIIAGVAQKIQNEETKFNPQSPYAVSKTAAFQLCCNYRKAYNLYIVSSLCFNHESPRRGDQFVTRKITKWISNNYIDIKKGKVFNDNYKLHLGNLDTKRDWGHAKDYCKAMRLIIYLNLPDDFVICTGKTYSIKEFLDIAFNYVGIKDWGPYIFIDQKFYRPSEVDYLCGDFTKINKTTGWHPEYNLEQIIKEMIDNDINSSK